MTLRVFLVVCTESNYRAMLKDAIECGHELGFAVQIIDLNGLNNNGREFRNDWKQFGICPYVLTANSLSELEQLRDREVSEASVVLFLNPPGGFMMDAWKILQKRCARIGLMVTSPVPFSSAANKQNPILKSLRTFARWLKSFTKPTPAVWVVSGSECILQYKSYFCSIRHTRYIYSHSIEYERLVHSESTGCPSGNASYILVLDQGWYSKQRPEYVAAEQYPPAPRSKFAGEMNAFLQFLTSKLNLEVIVSCHPKANLQDTKDFYSGYRVVDTPSAELIKNCYLAVANTSTSIQYAIIADKPLLLVTTDALLQSVVQPLQGGISEQLGLPYLNLSGDYEDTMLPLIERDRSAPYKKYMEGFIKQPHAPDIPLWQGVFTQLKQVIAS